MDTTSVNMKKAKTVLRDCIKVITEMEEREQQFNDYYEGVDHIPRIDRFSLDYMRGLFDGPNGSIVDDGDGIKIEFKDVELARNFVKNVEVSTTVDDDGYCVYFRGFNMIDFLGKIYPSTSIICNDNKYKWFKELISFNDLDCGVFEVRRKHEDAVIPSKPNRSDMGFDLTVIKHVKTVGEVEFYDTGLAIKPSLGYYCLIYPRSSISKTGYMLANGIGVIDPTFRGNYLVALRKVDKNAPAIELPCRIAQLVPQRVYYPDMIEVDNLDETNRGTGGFGSSNK